MKISNKILNKKVAKKPQPTTPRKKIDPNDPQYIIYKTLPFKKRKMSAGDWIYKNKIGVSALVIVTITLFFILVSVRFKLTTLDVVNGFLLEMPPEEKIVEEEKPTEQEKLVAEQIERQMYEDIKNARSNKSADLDGGLKDDRGTQASDLYDEAKALQDRINSNREAYQKGLAEEAAINDRKSQSEHKKGENEDQRKDSNIKGKVTISYDLGGRNASYLPMPAYKCEKGGEVTINITVNQNGDVITAELGSTTSRDDYCLNDTALSFAKRSRFEIGTSWPEKHKGTITYLFLNQ